MNVTINSKNVKAGERLAAAIENKMAKLDKYFSQDAEAVVMLSEEKSGLAKLEATIHAGSLTTLISRLQATVIPKPTPTMP